MHIHRLPRTRTEKRPLLTQSGLFYLSGDTAVIGAPRVDDNGNESGSAYVFDINPRQIISGP